MPSDFDQLQSALASAGADAVLAEGIALLRRDKKYHELFEVLKIRLRHKLGLPLLAGEATDGLSDEQRTKLEDGLIDACREVGAALLAEGKIREGWMYLRPVGDKAEAARLLAGIPDTDENYEELIDVCLHEGIDIGRGYGLVLDRFGTCNAITTFDSSLARRARGEQVAGGEAASAARSRRPRGQRESRYRARRKESSRRKLRCASWSMTATGCFRTIRITSIRRTWLLPFASPAP